MAKKDDTTLWIIGGLGVAAVIGYLLFGHGLRERSPLADIVNSITGRTPPQDRLAPTPDEAAAYGYY